ncbi:MAG TPA: glycosyltransferase family 4 protein [Candidatus Competibacteraceae bacterium]|nr:glycosyltransferase family 4 protein [Candidatus Competibacteraceae bacterium]
MIILIALAAFATALTLAFLLSRPAFRGQWLDYPNERSLHQRPVPRTGGLAILGSGLTSSFLLTLLVPATHPLLITLPLGLLPLAIISWLDDRQGMAMGWRFLVHFWAAVSLIGVNPVPNALDLPSLPWQLPMEVIHILSVLFVVWMINLYNFMDGMDGFAGGMAVIGFSALAWLGRVDTGFAAVCLSVAAASAGFLVCNFPPARIFLGDIGSTTFGFLAAACSLWGARMELFPLWVSLLVFSPFIMDATVTLIRRLLRGEKVWQAHRSHYYQRLVLLGWGHRRTVLVEYGLMLACAGSALLAVHLPPVGQIALAVIWVLMYGLLMRGVSWLEQRCLAAACQ